MTTLPTHPFLVHPRTGEPLRALGRTSRGRLMWPVLGASPDDPPAPTPAPMFLAPAASAPPTPTPAPTPAPAPAPADEDQLGEAGMRALAEERKARKAAETELATYLRAQPELARYRQAEKELAKYRKAEQDRADADKSEAEKRTAAEARAAAADLRAMKVEVAFAKGLTAAQAKRLVGATREELEADADEILKDFPATPPAPAAPPAPRPDPSQGARPGGTATVATGAALYAQRHPAKTAAS